MAKLNLSQAAKVVGKNRVTLWRHINAGKLSAERDRDGNPFIDTSELLRVYGELKKNVTHSNKEKLHEATPSYDELIRVIENLRKEQAEMKEQLTAITNRLSYVQKENSHGTEMTLPLPEDDPEWPKEIKSMKDVMLRNKIKNKYY